MPGCTTSWPIHKGKEGRWVLIKSQRAYANVVVPYTRETSKLSTLISGAAEVQ